MVYNQQRNNSHSGITASIPGYSKIHQKPEVQLTITEVSPTQVQASRFKVQDTIHNTFTDKSPIFNNHNSTINQDKPPMRIFTTIKPPCQWNIPQLNYNSDVPTIIK
jgi:hypothetical protein